MEDLIDKIPLIRCVVLKPSEISISVSMLRTLSP